MRSRPLVRNVLFNFIGQAAPLLAAAVALPTLAHTFGIDRLGVLTLAWVLLGSFGLLDFGLGRSLTQSVAARTRNRPRSRTAGRDRHIVVRSGGARSRCGAGPRAGCTACRGRRADRARRPRGGNTAFAVRAGGGPSIHDALLRAEGAARGRAAVRPRQHRAHAARRVDVPWPASGAAIHAIGRCRSRCHRRVARLCRASRICCSACAAGRIFV